jgi:D-alanyl-D-alanine carboxypeptidase/D-alanyl-D-alanine-endopeptidase (penicillin-binding protein 4)
VYIVGGGDPLLSIPDVEIIAAEIKNLGINKINGNIYGDGSFFDKISNRFHYSNDKDEVEPVAPVTALAIELNTVSVIVTSGAIAGKSVNVQFKPASSAFIVTNTAVVTAAESKKKKNTKTKTKTKSTANTITITTSLAGDGKQIFNVKGGLAPNRTYRYKYFISKPELAVAGILMDRLLAEGIAVTGDIAAKEYPKNEQHKAKANNLYTFTRNINDIIEITNKKSDNYLAETLFKLNGAVNRKEENLANHAKHLLMQTLANNNINHIGFAFNDGSGLSRRNLISTEALVQLLLKSRQKNFAQSFESSLSVAGIDGTLQKRMLNSYAENNLKGKTGTHRDVSSLAGFFENRSGDTLYFAFIFNGNNIGLYKSIENQICMKLAEF